MTESTCQRCFYSHPSARFSKNHLCRSCGVEFALEKLAHGEYPEPEEVRELIRFREINPLKFRILVSPKIQRKIEVLSQRREAFYE